MWRRVNILMNRYEPAPLPQYWPLHCIQEIPIPEEVNRHQFARHLLVRENDSNRGVYEQQTISRRI